MRLDLVLVHSEFINFLTEKYLSKYMRLYNIGAV